jgi:hypothetical protein
VPAALMVTVSPSTLTASDGEPAAAVLAPSASVTATSPALSQLRSSASKWVSSSTEAAVRAWAPDAVVVPAWPVDAAVPGTEQPASETASARAATEK